LKKIHLILGYGGLIPFFGLALLHYLNFENADSFLIAYAALIFSFLGGLLWKSTLYNDLPAHVIYISVTVMLWAWVWLIFNQLNWFFIASCSFFALYLYEKKYLIQTYPDGFIKLRLHLSMSATVVLLVVFFI
jgi:hypothetical protein|tara:strand:+ start:3096 stop:3494 length:399 start_codon:yes stop_codon:yes gene_type:complete